MWIIQWLSSSKNHFNFVESNKVSSVAFPPRIVTTWHPIELQSKFSWLIINGADCTRAAHIDIINGFIDHNKQQANTWFSPLRRTFRWMAQRIGRYFAGAKYRYVNGYIRQSLLNRNQFRCIDFYCCWLFLGTRRELMYWLRDVEHNI